MESLNNLPKKQDVELGFEPRQSATDTGLLTTIVWMNQLNERKDLEILSLEFYFYEIALKV